MQDLSSNGTPSRVGHSDSDKDGSGTSGGEAHRNQPAAYLRPFIAEYKFPDPEQRSKAQVNEKLEKVGFDESRQRVSRARKQPPGH